ncbi:MAG: protein kinase domain-containing protein, partial [Planctomycetota bacterium]
MGVVYEAEQVPLGRRVALKVLPFHRLLDKRRLDRFQREAQAAARLHHPNIVPVHGVGEHEGTHYFAMQYVAGQGLDAVIAELKRLRKTGESTSSVNLPREPGSETERSYFRSVAHIGIDVAGALEHAHSEGVLHRDIKPSNLLLDAEGKVWITDFGLAKADETEGLTRTGDVVGTVGYMAPERFQGWSDRRSDVYGLGLVLYELLALEPAFADSDINRLIKKVTEEEPSRLPRETPRDLETITRKAMAKDAGQRYATAGQLRADLERLLRGEPIQARRSTVLERTRKWARRRPAAAALVVVSTLAVLTVLTGSLWYSAQLRDQRQVAVEEGKRARESERDAKEQLWSSYLAQAEAGRLSADPRRQVGALAFIGKAAAIRPDVRLRDEAIACLLQVPEFDLVRVWVSSTDRGGPVAFDGDFERYARQTTDGSVEVRAVQGDRVVRTLPAVEGTLESLRLGPGGRYLAATFAEGGTTTACVWKVDNGETCLHAGAVSGPLAIDFRQSPRHLAVSSPDGTITVHDLGTAKVLGRLPGKSFPSEIRFHPNQALLGALYPEENRLRVWDLDSLAVAQEITPPFIVRSFSWDRALKDLFLLSGNQVYRWGKAVTPWLGDATRPLLGAFPDSGGGWGVLSWEDGTTSLDVLGRMTAHVTGSLAGISPVGRPGWRARPPSSRPNLVALRRAERVEIWTVVREPHRRTTLPKDDEVFTEERTKILDVSTEAGIFATGDSLGAHIWELRTGEALALVPQAELRSLQFLSDGRLLTVGRQGVLRWAIQRDAIGPPEILWGASDVGPVAASPEGNLLAMVHEDRLLLLDLAKEEVTDLGGARKVDDLAFHADGRWLLTNSVEEGSVRILDARSGREIRRLAGPARRLMLSPDGRWIATTVKQEGIQIWSVNPWGPHLLLPAGSLYRSLEGVAFSHDSTVMAIPKSGTTLELVSMEDGSTITTIRSGNGDLIRFSPDGAYLIGISREDRSIDVWNLRRI